MNDHRSFSYLVIAGTIGAGIAFLLTPRFGIKLRDNIGEELWNDQDEDFNAASRFNDQADRLSRPIDQLPPQKFGQLSESFHMRGLDVDSNSDRSTFRAGNKVRKRRRTASII